jgi:hypothetical protein
MRSCNAIIEHFVRQTIGFINPTSPHIAAEVFQPLRHDNPCDGISQHHLHPIEHAQGRFLIRVRTREQIVHAFVLDDSVLRAV